MVHSQEAKIYISEVGIAAASDPLDTSHVAEAVDYEVAEAAANERRSIKFVDLKNSQRKKLGCALCGEELYGFGVGYPLFNVRFLTFCRWCRHDV